mmetsp:Transcript_38917/g.93624  ORF Transcript_38917/g.93624 Transcript_38917/m.93624 type:complete len:214 (-) Transcript_38917:25-666(-)
MPLKVQVHAFPEASLPQQCAIHSDYFRALLIHGCSIEVIHRDVAIGADRVAHWPGILGELTGSQVLHVLNSFDSVAVHHVATELLVAVHSETFLERKLEPVAAGHSVACPVVKILVANDRLNTFIVGVSGRFGISKGQGSVEYVKTLVLHGTRIKVVHCNNVVHVQVVLQPERVLVPPHRLLQARHGMIQLGHVARLREDFQMNLASGRSGCV